MQAPIDWPLWRVYADQLLDQGDVRGQLVALEHDLATGRVAADQRLAALQKARLLESAHRDRWLAGWPVPEGPHTRLEWRFGFVIGVTLQWSADAYEILDALRAHPTARFLERLALRARLEGDVSLLATDVLRELSHLDLASAVIGDEGAVALARSRSLGALRSLELLGSRIGDEGARALAQSDALPSLTALGMAHNRLGPEGEAALLAFSRRGCQVTLR